MKLALVKLTMKYSPDQPRVPAGRREGGEWTNTGGGVRLAANDRGEGAIATDATIKHPTGSRSKLPPADAMTLHAGDGTPFYAPPTADFHEMYEYGQGLREKSFADQKAAIGKAIGQYGIFDFQRSNGNFIDAYKHVSNYGVGVVMNGAGFSWASTFALGVGYGVENSHPKYDPERVQWWYLGYQDAKNSRLPPRK
jgi:hypothetical protein